MIRVWVLLGLSLFSGAAAWADPASAFWLNNKGARLLGEDRNFEAGQSLIEGLAHSPFKTEIHLNLGLAFERQKELDKALSEYKTALTTTADPQMKFAAAFNAGRILGEQKKIDEALSYYQVALTLNPQSKETKTNIELLMAQGGGSGEGQQNKQGEGKGQGEGDDKKDGKEGKDKQDDKDQGQNKDKDNKDGKGKDAKNPPPPPKPKEFESNALSQSDVRKILEELKNQEQKIRRKEYDKKAKEAPGGKDW